MKTDRTAFEAAILAALADDAPRLVYADWLDERGEADAACDQRLAVALKYVLLSPDDDGPRLAYATVCEQYGRAARAEFVRVQVEYARLKANEADWISGHDLSSQADALLRRHGKDWFSPLRLTSRPTCVWRRGFVDELECSAADWLAHADELLAAHPVQEVRLTTMPEPNEGAAIYRRIWANGHETPDWPDPPGHVLERLLPLAWPSVRTWHLPPEPSGEAFSAQPYAGHRMGPVTVDEIADLPIDAGSPVTLGGRVVGRVVSIGRVELTGPLPGTCNGLTLGGEPLAEVSRSEHPPACDCATPSGFAVTITAGDGSADERLSAAPPDNARRRAGNTRMPGWLAERRARPSRTGGRSGR